MERLLNNLATKLKHQPDEFILSLLDEIGNQEQYHIEIFSGDIATALVASGEPIQIIWNENAKRKELIENLICKEAARRWIQLKSKKIEFANQ